MTSKTWDKYDQLYSISSRIDEMKRLAKLRAMQFNSTLGSTSLGAQMGQQLGDFWQVMQKAPRAASELDNKYHVTRSAVRAAKRATSRVLQLGSQILSTGSSIIGGGGVNGGSKDRSSRRGQWESSRARVGQQRSGQVAQWDGALIRLGRRSICSITGAWRFLVTGEPQPRSQRRRGGGVAGRGQTLGWTANVNPWASPFPRPQTNSPKRTVGTSSRLSSSIKTLTSVSSVNSSDDRLVTLLACALLLLVAKDFVGLAFRAIIATKLSVA